MKKSIVCAALILMTMLCGCGGGHDAYTKIYEGLTKLENYKAEVEVVTGGETYNATEYYLSPDMFRVDYTDSDMGGVSCSLVGDTLSFKGDDGKITKFSGYVPNEKFYIFVADFMKNYCTKESGKHSKKGRFTVLETTADEDNPAAAAQKLWINNETGLPDKMITYNKKGEKTVTVNFKTFEMNTKINKNTFKL